MGTEAKVKLDGVQSPRDVFHYWDRDGDGLKTICGIKCGHWQCASVKDVDSPPWGRGCKRCKKVKESFERKAKR